MKIALVHDYLKEYGGAEAVFEELSDIFPDAQIFTTVYRPSFFGPHKSRLEKKWQGRVHQSWFGFVPFAHKMLSPFRFLSPIAFKSFNFSGYDLIITSATGAFFPNSLNKKTARLVCYCHTPPRYLYNLATARSLDFWLYRLINIPLQIVLHFYRLFDFHFAQNVDQFVANSQTTAARIKKFYRQDAIIINPPINLPKPQNLPKNSSLKNKPSFYLTGGRLTFAKRYDIAIEACNKLNLQLRIFGRDFAGVESSLRKIAGSNVEFLGEVTNEERNLLFSQAKGFIFCSDNEDFGMMSVEAQGYGCPVIGYSSGGIRETVVDGKTGFLFDKLTPDSCAKAILKNEKSNLLPKDCVKNASLYGRDVFIKKIKSLVVQVKN